MTNICKSSMFKDIAVLHMWQMFVKYTSHRNSALRMISLSRFTVRYLASFHLAHQSCYNDSSCSECSDTSVKLISIFEHFELSKVFCSLLLTHVNYIFLSIIFENKLTVMINRMRFASFGT